MAGLGLAALLVPLVFPSLATTLLVFFAARIFSRVVLEMFHYQAGYAANLAIFSVVCLASIRYSKKGDEFHRPPLQAM